MSCKHAIFPLFIVALIIVFPAMETHSTPTLQGKDTCMHHQFSTRALAPVHVFFSYPHLSCNGNAFHSHCTINPPPVHVHLSMFSSPIFIFPAMEMHSTPTLQCKDTCMHHQFSTRALPPVHVPCCHMHDACTYSLCLISTCTRVPHAWSQYLCLQAHACVHARIIMRMHS